tara:strand:- start:378 stop:599 length:222 start_codon:yes stop_codon:yes gene_type:complete
MNQEKLIDNLINRDKERAYRIADRIFWIFIENTHPSYLNDYIEEDPDNPQGLRNTERGRELFNELEEFVKGTL